MKNAFVLTLGVVLFLILSPVSVQSQLIDLYVDPGHGGSDPGNAGAYIPYFSEDTINLLVGLILENYLNYESNYTYHFSRLTNNITLRPIARVYDAMEWEPLALISIHHNSVPGGVGPTQGTEVWWSSVPQSLDSPTTSTPGTYLGDYRNTDHKLAEKLALKIKQVFGYTLRGSSTVEGDTIPGIRDDALYNNQISVLCRTTMPSALTEASFISDSTEEEKFYYTTFYPFHREMEASAIFDAFDSWFKGQGFAKVDYAYAGQTPTDSHDVWIEDYLGGDTVKAPFLGVWNLDYQILIEALNFSQSAYPYQFHHWEHKNHFDTTVIDSYPFPEWIFNVDSAQDSTHWYVAYFKGGPFEIYTSVVGQMNIGTLDTIPWVCDPGVEGTGEFILQLSRNGGSTWTAIDTLPYNGANGNFLVPWSVTGPATQTAQLRFLAYDHADNKDTFVTFNFVICDGVDADCDGFTNSSDNCPSVSNPTQQDTDGDGDGNACDNCPAVANANQNDFDNDSWGDVCDNCPNIFQVNQLNHDGDSFGDECDNCRFVANNNQADSDTDGWGNVCDNCPNSSNPSQIDIDNDGLGDVCDTVLNWQMTYTSIPDKVAFSVHQSPSGGYLLCGHMQALPGPFSNGRQLNLIAINSAGNVTIDKNFIGSGIETGNCVRVRPDSTVVSVGSISTSGYTNGGLDMFLLKTSKILWTPLTVRNFGGAGEDVAKWVEVTSDGSCIIAGHTKSFGAGNADFYIVKTNSAFNMEWYKTFGGVQNDYAQAIQPTVGGGYAVAGITNSFGAGNTDMYLIKLNANGDSVWSKTYGYANSDSLFSMQQTFDKGFVLAGSTNSIGAGQSDMYVVRTDSLGNIIWSKTYGGISADGARTIMELPDHGFFIAGYTQSYGAGGADFYVLRTYYTGDTIWTRTYGDNNSEIAHSADLTLDGGYIVAGLKYGSALDSVTYVVKDGPLEAISCCLDTTGNANFDMNDQCNVLDMTFVIDKLFRGGPSPSCPEEADLNGDGQSCNILDMTFLVDAFFRGGPGPSHLCDPSKKVPSQPLSGNFFVELE